jgi:SAM-dependent methyltransferase
VRDAYSSVAEQYIGLIADDWQADDDDTALVRRHLTGLPGPVLDLGCGPGHWTAYLHSLGADVTGIDMVPEFIAHARAAHPGPDFRLASMTELDAPEHSLAGILTWYSTIHLPPTELDRVLAGFRRLLAPSGMLVVGFASDDAVAAFDHKFSTAYRWPADVFAEHLADAGLHRGAAPAAEVRGTPGPQVRRHSRPGTLNCLERPACCLLRRYSPGQRRASGPAWAYGAWSATRPAKCSIDVPRPRARAAIGAGSSPACQDGLAAPPAHGRFGSTVCAVCRRTRSPVDSRRTARAAPAPSPARSRRSRSGSSPSSSSTRPWARSRLRWPAMR